MDFVRSSQSFGSNVTDLPLYEHVETPLPIASRRFILTLLLMFVVAYSSRHLFLTSKPKNVQFIAKDGPEDDFEGTRSESLKDQLEGTWHLESYHLEVKGPVRITSHPFGKEAIGRLIYTPSGHMSVNIMRPGCMPFRADNPHGGTVQENGLAAAYYMAYSGRYETFEHKGQSIVQHLLDSSLYPNWLETTQFRLCELDGDELVLRPKKMPRRLGMEVGAVLRWRRASSVVRREDTKWVQAESIAQLIYTDEDPAMSLLII